MICQQLLQCQHQVIHHVFFRYWRILSIDKKTGFYHRSFFFYFFPPLTAAFSVAPALNVGCFEALIFNSAPVFGLRPVRAARLRTSNDPKPTSEMESPDHIHAGTVVGNLEGDPMMIRGYYDTLLDTGVVACI